LDIGYFRTDVHKAVQYERFAYEYLVGAWMQHGPTGDWSELSAGGLSAHFIADGGLYNLLNGWIYGYDPSRGVGFFRNQALNAWRFMYEYDLGQWYHMGAIGGWALLGASNLAADFLGDGHTRTLGNGFDFQYAYVDDNGDFLVGSAARFRYEYDVGQWWHKGPTGDWTELGISGFTARYIANGSLYDLGNGWTFGYDTGSSVGFYRNNALNAWRFMYRYSGGKWYHMGKVSGWAAITASDYSAEFVGDGEWHELDDWWSYSYSTSSDYGYFKIRDSERFYYSYGPSQWYHKGNATDWAALSAAGVSALFVGDGSDHDLGNGFAYQYVAADEEGYFKVGSAERLSYDYAAGQWSHKGNNTDWAALTGSDYSAAFLGDGADHDLGNGFAYCYGGGDSGYFKEGDSERFDYWYNGSQWFVRSDRSDWEWLSSEGASAQFVGDGAQHDLGTGWWYHYSLDIHTGYWGKGDTASIAWDTPRFAYYYTIGLWEHRGYYGNYHNLGDEGWWNPSFLGDGDQHWVNGDSNYQYRYDYSEDNGYWDAHNKGADWKYYYDTGDWWKYSHLFRMWEAEGPAHADTHWYNPR